MDTQMKYVVLAVNEEQFKILRGLQFWKSYSWSVKYQPVNCLKPSKLCACLALGTCNDILICTCRDCMSYASLTPSESKREREFLL